MSAGSPYGRLVLWGEAFALAAATGDDELMGALRLEAALAARGPGGLRAVVRRAAARLADPASVEVLGHAAWARVLLAAARLAEDAEAVGALAFALTAAWPLRGATHAALWRALEDRAAELGRGPDWLAADLARRVVFAAPEEPAAPSER